MQEPEASSDGLGGTYFFMNEAGRRAAIVKPCDEEPMAPNNPKVLLLSFSIRAYSDDCNIFKDCHSNVILHCLPGASPEAIIRMMQGFVGRAMGEPGLKPSVRVGEAATREVAAFLLDHEHFAKVPHTVMVKVRGPVGESVCRRRGCSLAVMKYSSLY